MGSIPLAANNLKVPEPGPNALDILRQVAQLHGAQQENQQRDLAIQTQQRDVQDDKTIRDAYGKNNGDVDKTLQDIAGKVSPAKFQAAQQHAYDLKQKAAALVSQQGDIALKQSDMMQGAHDVVDKATADQKPVIYQQQLQGLHQAGVDVSQMPPQYPGDEAFKTIGLGIKTHSKLMEDALKQTEGAKNAAQAGEATARTGEAEAQTRKINLETNPDNPANPDIRKQKYEGILQKVQTGGLSTVSPADLSFARSYENGQRKTTTQSDSLGVTSVNTSAPSGLAAASGGRAAAPAAGGNVTPQGNATKPTNNVKNSIVDLIGQYKDDPNHMARLIAKHPDILAAVQQKYPDWSQPNYNAANKAITDLGPSGKTGQQITSYNTFLRHAGALYDAVNSLDNSKYSDLVNKPMNWLAQHTGDPRVADFMAAMQPPMKEFQSFLLNNHAMHDEDVKDAHALIDQNKTPQEIKAVLNRFAETGSARLSEQNESFKRVTGRDIPNLVSPQAAAAYNKITAKGGGGGHVIKIGDKQYQYKGKGDTADLNNYTQIQ